MTNVYMGSILLIWLKFLLSWVGTSYHQISSVNPIN